MILEAEALLYIDVLGKLVVNLALDACNEELIALLAGLSALTELEATDLRKVLCVNVLCVVVIKAELLSLVLGLVVGLFMGLLLKDRPGVAEVEANVLADWLSAEEVDALSELEAANDDRLEAGLDADLEGVEMLE